MFYYFDWAKGTSISVSPNKGMQIFKSFELQLFDSWLVGKITLSKMIETCTPFVNESCWHNPYKILLIHLCRGHLLISSSDIPNAIAWSRAALFKWISYYYHWMSLVHPGTNLTVLWDQWFHIARSMHCICIVYILHITEWRLTKSTSMTDHRIKTETQWQHMVNTFKDQSHKHLHIFREVADTFKSIHLFEIIENFEDNSHRLCMSESIFTLVK